MKALFAAAANDPSLVPLMRSPFALTPGFEGPKQPPGNKPLFDQLKSKRQELRQASEGGTFNEALATQKLTEMASLEAKAMGERFRLQQETMSVLTAEQKAQLEQSKAQFKARREMRKGNNE